MKLLLDGRIQDSEEAVISVYDHGFLYGMGLFETFRTYGGKPWLLNRHAERLAASCGALGIAYAPDPARMAEDVKRLLAANGLADGYVRWSVSAGAGEIGLPEGDYARPREIVYMKPLAPDRPETRAGKRLRLLRLARSTPEGGEPRLKSFHYMNNMLAKRELTAGGAAPGTEGLFLSPDGYVSEGLVSNVFWAKDGVLYTPALETGPLPGITRGWVLTRALETLGPDGVREVREGRYRWDALLQADEAFVTNSVQEIVPVVALEEPDGTIARPWPEGPGRATRRLMTAYRLAAEQGSEDMR
ncbi:aminotransferase class IV [Cohnella nanjingensis]|uniref:Aminotransferase class IV n=1 Tax=Cohnella nanjingensis TaxID=1387779 RepID=A0A7X0RNQ1_9BACL|nr:aminotransferase class IV [Cohnella nanjingensis]MBB6669600.1 aminotransferase class IV [Cohnella nanjingensis]